MVDPVIDLGARRGLVMPAATIRLMWLSLHFARASSNCGLRRALSAALSLSTSAFSAAVSGGQAVARVEDVAG